METQNFVEILLTEDNDYDAEMAMIALEEKNISRKVHRVRDGEEALEFLFAVGEYADRKSMKLPRLILLDLKMPRINGLEVLAKIKSSAQTKQIPVVMLTSSQEEQDIVKSYKLGVNSYIVKPLDFSELSKVIGKIASYWISINHPYPPY
jgi:CheY-like chemotaxis protein